MSRRRQLAPRLANIDKAIATFETTKALRELGRRGQRKWIVIRIHEDETEAQARTRTFALHPWVADLSDEARARLQLIVVRRSSDSLLSA